MPTLTHPSQVLFEPSVLTPMPSTKRKEPSSVPELGADGADGVAKKMKREEEGGFDVEVWRPLFRSPDTCDFKHNTPLTP